MEKKTAPKSRFKKGLHNFAVDVVWQLGRSVEVEAKSRAEAKRIVKGWIDSGELAISLRGNEHTVLDEVEVRTSGEETVGGEIEYF